MKLIPYTKQQILGQLLHLRSRTSFINRSKRNQINALLAEFQPDIPVFILPCLKLGKLQALNQRNAIVYTSPEKLLKYG